MSPQGKRIFLGEDAPDIREVFTVLLRVESADVVATGRGRGRSTWPITAILTSS